MIKILFADDDLKYSMLLKSFLQQHGYDVTYAGNGKKAWEQFPEVKPDLVLLDINMPEMDGYEVAERIRTIDPKVLIFFLTDRTEKNDRLKGFSLKANDYLAKPFYPEELLARIEERFSMNESETIEEEVYHFGETIFCYNNNELRTRSSRVLITSRQADILRLLAKNIGNVVSKEMIQEAVWGTVSYANSLAVNVQMTYLRHALQHDAIVKIESLKKKGYVLTLLSEV
ncbi:response regulator transcription factor [Segatella copri]|uniref:response regulator transcription factor n=1 Tax=Segatella copri TaxID=165179 RepID=UPI002FF43C8E